MRNGTKIVGALLFLSISWFSSTAQHFSPQDYGHVVIARTKNWDKGIIKKLKIGDTIPNFLLENVQNWTSPNIHLSDFKKKLIVIDFWGINCSGCINSIPGDEAIQTKYGDKIQILMVTRDIQDAVDYTKTTADYVKKCSLPMYNDDQNFYKYFVYTSLPRLVWIDENGVILASGDDLLTPMALDNYFKHHIVPAPENDDVYFDFDRTAPAFVEGFGRNFGKVRYYSVIMDTINGLGGNNRIEIDRDSTTKRIRRILLDNYSLFFVWDVVMMEEQNASTGVKLGFVFDIKRTLFEVSDTNVFRRAGLPIGDFRGARAIGYELQMPDRPGVDAATFMRTDLERHFGITFNVEKRDVECWVLQKAAGNEPTKLSGDQALAVNSYRPGEKSMIGYNDAIKKIVVRNTSVGNFLYYLQREVEFPDKKDALPIVVSDRDTSSMRVVNFLLRPMANNGTHDKSRLSFDDLRQDVESFGYQIVRKRESIPMVIIKDIH